MVIVLIFAEVLGLYGMIVSIILFMSGKNKHPICAIE